MAGEEAVSVTMTAAQKSMEVTAELISKLAVPLLKTSGKVLWGATKLGAKAVAGAVNSRSRTGNISVKELLLEADKAQSATLSESGVFASDAEIYTAKAKQYGVPISIIGDGDKVTLSFLERDKAAVRQIIEETLREKLKTTPQEVKHFAISEQNVQALKEAFNKNGVECCFTKNSKGEVFCQYQAKDAERAQLIKDEFKATQDELIKNFTVTPSKSGLGTITDVSTGKTVDLSQYGGKLRQYQTVNLLQKEFGYPKDKALYAANKLCEELNLDRKEFFAHTKQLDDLELLKTNIRYEKDDILLKDTSISAIKFADGEHMHISVELNGKAAYLTPATMTREEMEKICVTDLGMSEAKAAAAVDKTMKIDAQINSKNREKEISKTSGSQTVEIDKTSNNSFSVKVGGLEKSYGFADKDLESKISKDLGITRDKAKGIVKKARSQNAFSNNIDKAAKKSSANKSVDLTKNIKMPTGKGARA